MKTKLSIAIAAIGLTGLSALALSSNTTAQEAAAVEASTIEEIRVIGSRRLGRTVEDSPVPIDVLDSDSLSRTGLTETNQILRALLPSFNFPQPSITDGTDHVRPAQ